MRLDFSLLLALLLLGTMPALAKRVPQLDDQFDTNLLQVEESRYLGQAIPDVAVVTATGTSRLSELMAGQPTILLLAYYSCGHSCPVTVRNLLQSNIDTSPSDYRVIVLSFDGNDTLSTMSSTQSTLPPVPANWTFGLLDSAASAQLTEAVGYKYFFSERDQTFVHPSVLIFLSPEQKVMRYLYGAEPRSQDIELALVESRNRAPHLNEVVEMLKLTCMQFDAARSRYVLHPTLLFGGAGFGVLGLVGLAVLTSKKDSLGRQ